MLTEEELKEITELEIFGNYSGENIRALIAAIRELQEQNRDLNLYLNSEKTMKENLGIQLMKNAEQNREFREALEIISRSRGPVNHPAASQADFTPDAIFARTILAKFPSEEA